MSVHYSRNIFATMFAGIVLINCGGGGGGGTPAAIDTPPPALVIPSITELSGNWAFHSLDSGATPGWRQGFEQRTTAGAVTQTSITKNDASTTTDADYSLTIDSAGIITHSTEPTYRGVISQDRKLVINTLSLEPDAVSADTFTTFRIEVAQLLGDSYAMDDLVGNWNFHSLRSGANAQWRYGVEQMNVSGNVTRESLTDSNGDITPGADYILAMDSSGVLTRPDLSSYHGVMSQDKQLIVSTRSNLDGDGYRLEIMQKQGGVFSMSDLAGRWYFHSLRSGASSQWRQGLETIDASGNVERTLLNTSDGDTIPGSPYTLTMDAGGVITRTDTATYHGVMSQDKKLIVMTRSTDGGTAFRMELLHRAD
ncbi:MAG: hypothetical protein ISR73_10560 [Gammaproteobacteria bacterium]|nr:hypothetical protein [Gammaproteobacteria bacterium]